MATDAEIRAKGIKFLPLQKYLQNPYEFPVEEEAAPVQGGITNTNAFTGSGGDNFSVYNPDPNSIVNRNYRPNYDYRQFSEYGSDPSTADIKQMDINQDYFYKPPVNSKLKGLMSMIPYSGLFTKGAKFLGDQIGPYLPVNRRAIMENELGGQGIMVNDIGQIVQGKGDYNTSENVMAGYNANKITQETIDKRKATINETIKRKSAADPNYDPSNLNERLTALDEFGNTLDSTNTLTDKIFDFEEEEKKKKKKNTIVNRYITEKKEKKASKDLVDVEAVKANIKKAEDATYYTPDGTPGGGAGQGIDISNAGTIRSSDNNFQGDSGPTTKQESEYGYGSDFGFAKGGRAGYFFGGRVNYKAGGRINFRGGGADMGAPEKAAERTSKGYGTAPDTGSKSGTNDYSSFEQNVNHQKTMRNNQKPKVSTIDKAINLGSELSYLNNLKNLNVPAIALNFGVNKFRDYIKNKNLSEEDKLSYNTALPTNNYTAKLVGPALAQMRTLEKAKGMEQFGGPFSIEQGNTLDKLKQMDQEETIYSKPIKFTAANGGRAMFKNGGLASIL